MAAIDEKLKELSGTLTGFIERHEKDPVTQESMKTIVKDMMEENNKVIYQKVSEENAVRISDAAESEGVKAFGSKELAQKVSENSFALMAIKTITDSANAGLLNTSKNKERNDVWKTSSVNQFKDLFGNTGGKEVHKALFSLDGGGSGGEFITTEFGETLIDALRFQDPLMANLRRITVPRGRKSFNLPTTTSRATVFAISQGSHLGTPGTSRSEVADSNPGTGEITWTPGSLAALTYFDMDMEEDSRVPTFEFISVNLKEDLATFMAKATYTGDTVTGTTNINFDGGSPTTTAGSQDWFLGFNGLKKFTFGDTANRQIKAAAAALITQIAAGRALGKRYMVGQNKWGIFTGIEAFLKYVQDPEVTTLEKYGKDFTNLTGELARVHGAPLFVTEEGLPLSASSNGKVSSTTANNTKGSTMLINFGRNILGMKKDITLAVDEFPLSQQAALIAVARHDVQIADDGRGGTPDVLIYDQTV